MGDSPAKHGYDKAEWSAWYDEMRLGKDRAWSPTKVMYHLEVAQQEIERLLALMGAVAETPEPPDNRLYSATLGVEHKNFFTVAEALAETGRFLSGAGVRAVAITAMPIAAGSELDRQASQYKAAQRQPLADSRPDRSDLVGQQVRLNLTTSRDTYYGTLESANGNFVILRDLMWGWYGEAGWWQHGKAGLKMFPTASVKDISPDTDPPGGVNHG